MNQQEIVKGVATMAGLTLKSAKGAVQAIVDIVASALVKGTRVRTGLGTFSISKRSARKGRNPKTGAAIKIAASKSVRFKASKTVKDLVNKRATAGKTRGRRGGARARKGARRG